MIATVLVLENANDVDNGTDAAAHRQNCNYVTSDRY